MLQNYNFLSNALFLLMSLRMSIDRNSTIRYELQFVRHILPIRLLRFSRLVRLIRFLFPNTRVAIPSFFGACIPSLRSPLSLPSPHPLISSSLHPSSLHPPTTPLLSPVQLLPSNLSPLTSFSLNLPLPNKIFIHKNNYHV